MSLYNLVNGIKPGTFFLLPFIGKGHHPDEFPRFRDFFTGDSEKPETEGKFIIYTRTGGGNRDSYVEGNDFIRSIPGYLYDYDDSFDNTFACWVFEPPEEFSDDIKKILDGDIKGISPHAQDRIRAVYPKLKEKFDSLWGRDGEEPNEIP